MYPQFFAYDLAQLVAKRHTDIEPCAGTDHKDRRDFKHRQPSSLFQNAQVAAQLSDRN